MSGAIACVLFSSPVDPSEERIHDDPPSPSRIRVMYVRLRHHLVPEGVAGLYLIARALHPRLHLCAGHNKRGIDDTTQALKIAAL